MRIWRAPSKSWCGGTWWVKSDRLVKAALMPPIAALAGLVTGDKAVRLAGFGAADCGGSGTNSMPPS
jgi:hypothetical protein